MGAYRLYGRFCVTDRLICLGVLSRTFLLGKCCLQNSCQWDKIEQKWRTGFHHCWRQKTARISLSSRITSGSTSLGPFEGNFHSEVVTRLDKGVMSGHQRQAEEEKNSTKAILSTASVPTYLDELHYDRLSFNIKDTQKKDDVGLGHKLSLAAAVDIALWRTGRH